MKQYQHMDPCRTESSLYGNSNHDRKTKLLEKYPTILFFEPEHPGHAKLHKQ